MAFGFGALLSTPLTGENGGGGVGQKNEKNENEKKDEVEVGEEW